MSSDPVLANRNESFLDGDDRRLLRILAEYLQPPQASHPERPCDSGLPRARTVAALVTRVALMGYQTRFLQRPRLGSRSVPRDARRPFTSPGVVRSNSHAEWRRNESCGSRGRWSTRAYFEPVTVPEAPRKVILVMSSRPASVDSPPWIRR